MLPIDTNDNFDITVPDNKRLDYWFPEKQKQDLAPILSIINAVEDQKVRIFLLCSFSNILKRCSRWMNKSTKPTIDKDKIIADAYKSFQNQIEKMATKNEKFWNMLAGGRDDRIIVDCVVDNTDARKLKINDDSVTLVITSPPYVTSYEYADLHQLSSIWLGYIDNLPEFRSKFIGSIQKDFKSINLYSKTGKETVGRLRSINKREANGVEQYFFEMQQCFNEIYRVLKHRGRAAIVVGDTDLRGVKIQNAIVFAETLRDIGFKMYNIIKREVPSKTLPTKRDRKTGRFAATKVYNRLAYPTEYILIMEKI
jgi:DNA methylase